jgi:hypothetical protein
MRTITILGSAIAAAFATACFGRTRRGRSPVNGLTIEQFSAQCATPESCLERVKSDTQFADQVQKLCDGRQASGDRQRNRMHLTACRLALYRNDCHGLTGFAPMVASNQYVVTVGKVDHVSKTCPSLWISYLDFVSPGIRNCAEFKVFERDAQSATVGWETWDGGDCGCYPCNERETD